jgi:hypothetical protein
MTPAETVIAAAERVVADALARLLDPCPKCGRITDLDEDGYRVCGRPHLGPVNSCGWRSRHPVER